MKNVRFLLLSTGAIFLICLFAVPTLQAQVNNPTQQLPPDKTLKTAPKLPYCDEAVAAAKAKLQAYADEKCETANTCVQCLDRASNVEIYANVYIQPKSDKCKTAVNIGTTLKPTAKLPDFYFEIFQSVCTVEGTTLRVIFPESSMDATNFTYTWEIDGQAAGQTRQVSCVCGKTANVTVTEKGTRRSVSKTMDLQEACKASKE